jgi:hypothetical protein
MAEQAEARHGAGWFHTLLSVGLFSTLIQRHYITLFQLQEIQRVQATVFA